MAKDRSIPPTLYDLKNLPVPASTTADSLTRSIPRAKIDIPEIVPVPKTPVGFFTGRPKYDVQTELFEGAARAAAAAEKLVRNATSLDQALQDYALQIAKREFLPILHMANGAQAETVLFAAFANRVNMERAFLTELRGRDADGYDHDRTQAIAAHNHAITIHGKRQKAVEAKQGVVRAEDVLRRSMAALLQEIEVHNQQTFNDPVHEDAPEFVDAYAEEERRADINRTAKRRKDKVLRGGGSEESEQEQLDRIEQSRRRALKQYDLGQAGIKMPADEEV